MTGLLPTASASARVVLGRCVRSCHMWLGASSYSLYLIIHPIFLPFFDVAGLKVGLDGHLYWISFWIQLLAAVACGRIFYWLVERNFISSNHGKTAKRGTRRMAGTGAGAAAPGAASSEYPVHLRWHMVS